jgi:hypothetical protein
VESAVERNQRTIRRYFCQPAVRWYGRIVAVLKYSVRACGVNKLGVPKLLRCTITYEYKIRSANCIGETEGWKEAKWQKSHDAAHLVSMINGDCDIVADICDSGVYVRRMESLSDSSSISNPIHNC